MTTGNFYYQDSLGNTSHVTDAAGNLLERYTYSAFGTPTFYYRNAAGTEITSAASNFGIKHLFQGQLWTQETGLNDYRNRVEFPTMGVFLQPDPIGFKGDAANIYRFCGNDPVDRSDPMGLLDRELADRNWQMACFFDSGNSYQGSWDEFNNRNHAAGTAQSSTPGGNWKDTNIQNHIKKGQEVPGVTDYVNSNVESGVVKPKLDWWVQDGKEDKKVVLGELEHVSRYLWSLEKGPLGAAVRRFNANPSEAYAKAKLENARLVEKIWQRDTLHGSPNRHDMSQNPRLWQQMKPLEIQKAIQNVRPEEDPRPLYLGY